MNAWLKQQPRARLKQGFANCIMDSGPMHYYFSLFERKKNRMVCELVEQSKLYLWHIAQCLSKCSKSKWLQVHEEFTNFSTFLFPMCVLCWMHGTSANFVRGWKKQGHWQIGNANLCLCIHKHNHIMSSAPHVFCDPSTSHDRALSHISVANENRQKSTLYQCMNSEIF